MKIRPLSATSTKTNRIFTNQTTPTHTVKRNLKVLMSSEETARFLDSQIFKLTEASMPNCKELASLQVSKELKQLKSFTNSVQLSKSQINWKIERLAIELSQAKTKEKYVESKIPGLLEEIIKLKEKIEAVKALQEEKLADREVYNHVQQRLVNTKIFLDIKTNDLQERLSNKQHFLRIENNAQIKTREGRCQSARMYKNFYRTAEFFHKNTSIKAKNLEKNQKVIANMQTWREKRKKRQTEICEEVENEETIRNFKGIRESIMVCRVWYMFLSNKLAANVSEFGTIELAFRKIRSVTGLFDIQV